MTKNSFKLKALSFFVAVGSVLTGQAYAGSNDLYVGPQYSSGINLLLNGNATSFDGGSMNPSTLNGLGLKSLWCIDLADDTVVDSHYLKTAVTFNGGITATVNGVGSNFTVNNAGQIAYVVNSFTPLIGTRAKGLDGNAVNEQKAIQALIWSKEYNSGSYVITADPTAAYYKDFSILQNLAANKSMALNTAYWISPDNGSGTVFQALVAPGITALPEPEEWAMMLLGLPLIGWAVRRKRA